MNKLTAILLACGGLLLCAVLVIWNHNRGDQPGGELPGPQPDPITVKTPEPSLPDGKSLSVMRPFLELSLTDQTGATWRSNELLGKAWIACFFEMRDTVGTAALTADLIKLEQEFTRYSAWPNVQLVCITEDPEHDTLNVLRDYSDQLHADPRHWKFLTGDAEHMNNWNKDTFFLNADTREDKKPVSMKLMKPQFMLVDPQGDVRGSYDSGSESAFHRLTQDVNTVLQERVLLVPNLLDPPWLEVRRREQLATIDQFQVFCDFQFSDRVRESGIQFRHRMVDDGGRSYVTAHYDHGNGIAVADVDGDGRLDILFVSQVGGNELWRNLGGGKFENITARAGVALAEPIKVTASFADIDNDGDADLYITTVRGGNVLFENDGRGNFRDITEHSGLGYRGHSSGAVFFDFDRDGLLDLFLVNVGIYTTEKQMTVVNDAFTGSDKSDYSYFTSNADAFAAHLKPGRAEQSILFHNAGNRRFEDVSEATGLVDTSWSGDATALDANDDGWPDLYLVNMQGHDEYYENVAGKTFVKKSREVFPATPWGAMGIKVFDFDNDGRQDIFVTDMHTDMRTELGPLQEKQKIAQNAIDPTLLGTDGNHVMGNALFRKTGPNQYEEVSEATGAETFWPWGPSVGDLNADGFDDIFVAAGMNFPFRYGINSVLLNNRGKKFLDSEFILGVEPRRGGRTAAPWFELDANGKDREHPVVKMLRKKNVQVSRAVVWGALGTRSAVIFDLDDDGDLDIVTNDFNLPPMVLFSNLADRLPAIHFLKVELTGKKSNRDGLGATVKVQAGEHSYTKVHDGKSGYLSQSLMPLYFGLGDHDAVDKIEVRWPSGQTQIVSEPIRINSTLEIVEP